MNVNAPTSSAQRLDLPVPWKRPRLAGLTLAALLIGSLLPVSGCNADKDPAEACMGDVFSTDSAEEATPMGVNANQMRAGLGPVQTLTLRRNVSEEDTTQIPEDLGPEEDGVTFRLQNAPELSEVKVEIASVEPEARYSWLMAQCAEEGCAKEPVCMARSSLEVQLKVSSHDGTLDATLPMKLDYYPEQDRNFYPGFVVRPDQLRNAEHVFFGRAHLDIEDNAGALRVVDARGYRGQNIEAIGLQFNLGIADGEVRELEVGAVFDFEFDRNKGGTKSKTWLLYSNRPAQR